MADKRKRQKIESAIAKYPEYVTAIGRINIEINILDTCLSRLMGSAILIHPEIASVIYLTPKSSTARLEILENVIKKCFLPGEVRTKIESLIKRAERLMRKRHDYTHCIWGEKDGVVHKIDNPLFKADKEPIPIKLEQLTQMIEDIGHLSEDVISASSFLGATHPLLKK